MTKRAKRKVDFRRLFKSVACRTGFQLSFRASKIDYVELSNLDVSLSRLINFWALDRDCEHSVIARGVLIHVGRSDMAHQVALLEDLQHILWIFDHVGRQILHIHTRVFII